MVAQERIVDFITKVLVGRRPAHRRLAAGAHSPRCRPQETSTKESETRAITDLYAVFKVAWPSPSVGRRALSWPRAGGNGGLERRGAWRQHGDVVLVVLDVHRLYG